MVCGALLFPAADKKMAVQLPLVPENERTDSDVFQYVSVHHLCNYQTVSPVPQSFVHPHLPGLHPAMFPCSCFS